MSGEAEQEFFADGLTEDILTELSRFRHLFVISRNSAFKYKGKAVDVRQVARELRVQYVVEGSVRKVGNRVRVTVQLIDVEADASIATGGRRDSPGATKVRRHCTDPIWSSARRDRRPRSIR